MKAHTVLVVEDDPQAVELLELRLERLGCGLVATARADQAVALALAHQPFLALVDLKLGDDPLAGLAVIQALKENPATAAIPVLIHSIFVRYQHEVPAGGQQANGVLPKPPARDQLGAVVADLLAHLTPD